ncbi:hypothetical protein FQA39_LY05019 [Lamprigera yunnana]|nr:hypothetical protein FQA39_LY05019 [Lamprigera yunnana]
MELAMREMEDMQIEANEFIEISYRIKCNLKAKLEELRIRETEVSDCRDIFEQTIVIEGIDALTGRIPAEKFLRYMEEWLKNAETTIGKMRLKTSTLKSLLGKLSTQLVQKEELGEAVDAVDFEQLQIDNKHLAEAIEQKNNHLLELKRVNGTASLVLTTNKKYLQKQILEIQRVKNSIKVKQKKIIELENESEAVQNQVIKEKEKFDKIYRLTIHYSVPEVLEYIKVKVKLLDLKKQLKMWERKNKVQQFGLKSCIRQMKKLTGISQTQSAWFQVLSRSSMDSFASLDELLNLNQGKLNLK